MIRIALFLFVVLAIRPWPSAAQLIMRHSAHLGTWNVTAYAEDDCERGDGDYRCAEVVTAFFSLPGATYHASISATPLRRGPHVVEWTPYILCPQSSVRVPTCTQTGTGRELFWQIGGRIRYATRLEPGHYKSTAVLTIDGPEGLHTTRVLTTFEVEDTQLSCRVSSGGDVNFGKGEAWQSGTITLDPVTGSRSYGLGQQDAPEASTYSLATISVSTTAKSATVTVTSPSHLRAGTHTVTFTSLLAYQPPASSMYELLLTGSGNRSVKIGSSGRLAFRLGGRVTTGSTAEIATYAGTVTVGFLCAQDL